MTKRVVIHLKIRLRNVEVDIRNLQTRIKALKQSIKIAEEDLFAYQVEYTALNHAYGEWKNDSVED